jgi:hypothetical protein
MNELTQRVQLLREEQLLNANIYSRFATGY